MSAKLYLKEIECLACGNKFNTSKYKDSKFCSKECQFYKPIFLTERDIEILEGSIISDGSILKTKKNTNFQFKHTCKHLEYVKFLQNSLSFTSKVYSMNTRDAHTLSSFFHPVFTQLRQKWYPDNIKKIPNNLNITPVLLLHWYLGDGHLRNSNGITLCTDSFLKKDIEKTILQIKDKYKIESYYQSSNNRIIIPNKYVFEFLNIIGECPVYCYSYKWDTFIKESYFDRTCSNIECSKKFNASQNHQKHCNEQCYKRAWAINHKFNSTQTSS